MKTTSTPLDPPNVLEARGARFTILSLADPRVAAHVDRVRRCGCLHDAATLNGHVDLISCPVCRVLAE